MSAFNTATILLFSGISLVALAIWLLSRRYSSSAFAVGLTGLLTLTMASTWITAAVPVPVATQPKKELDDAKEPQEIVASKNTGMEEARGRARAPATKAEPAERQLPSVDVEQLVGELRNERSRRAEIERTATDAELRAATATARATELEDKIRAAHVGKEEAERRAALIEAKLREIPPPSPALRPPDLQVIRRKLTDGDRPFYAAQDERELIPGKKGNWYVVRLLQDGRPLTFADRQFALYDSTEIKVAVGRLRDEVLIPLSKAGKSWQLFVRGAADARRVVGPVGQDLFYLPTLPNGTYASEPRGKRVSVPVQNEDLPTLRADWLRGIVRAALGTVLSRDIDILENPPQPDHGRTAELIVFVEW